MPIFGTKVSHFVKTLDVTRNKQFNIWIAISGEF